MIRLLAFALVVTGMTLGLGACTNTVRGLGQDFSSQHIQSYNDRTATNLD